MSSSTPTSGRVAIVAVVLAATGFATAAAAAETLSPFQARHADLVAASRAAGGPPEIQPVGPERFDKDAMRAGFGLPTSDEAPGAESPGLARRPMAPDQLALGLAFDSHTLLQAANGTLIPGQQYGLTPPDTMGVVGPTQFGIAENELYRWVSKTTGVPDTSLDVRPRDFWLPAADGGNSSGGDPRIRYDRLTDRWIITAFTTNTLNRLLVAVSDGPIVSGATVWTQYFFIPGATLGDGASLAVCFADYPTLGVDALGIYLGANMFPGTALCGPTQVAPALFVIPRASLPPAGGDIAGITTSFNSALAFGNTNYAWSITPADNYDPTATVGYFIAQDGISDTTLRLGRIMNPGGAPTVSYAAVAIANKNDGWAAFDRGVEYPGVPAPVGDPSGPYGLDALGFRPLGGAHVRNGHLWTTVGSSVEGPQGDLRLWPLEGDRNSTIFYEINIATNSVFQEGNIYDDVTAVGNSPRHAFMGTVMVNGQGHAAAGFTYQNDTTLGPSGAYSSRLATDPLGQFDPPTVYRAGNAAAVDMRQFFETSARETRWGDYSMTSLDPCDDMTLWTIQEYRATPNTIDYQALGFGCGAPPCLGGNWGVTVAQILAPPPVASGATGVTAGSASIPSTVTGTGFYSPPTAGISSCRTDLAAATAFPGLVINGISYTGPTQVVLDLDTSAVVVNGVAAVTIANPDGQTTVVNVAIGGVEPPSLSVTKTVASDFVDTHAATYTVTISNAGPGDQLDNPGDEFVDVLPAELLLTGASATSGTVTVDLGLNTVRWNGSIAAGASVTITIDAVIYAAPGTTVVNQGTVYEDSDADGTNDTAIPTDDPGVVGVTDPTVFTVLGILQVIPTLGTAGYVVLALALALLSVWWLRRRRIA